MITDLPLEEGLREYSIWQQSQVSTEEQKEYFDSSSLESIEAFTSRFSSSPLWRSRTHYILESGLPQCTQIRLPES
jgi:hypothetical protein